MSNGLPMFFIPLASCSFCSRSVVMSPEDSMLFTKVTGGPCALSMWQLHWITISTHVWIFLPLVSTPLQVNHLQKAFVGEGRDFEKRLTECNHVFRALLHWGDQRYIRRKMCSRPFHLQCASLPRAFAFILRDNFKWFSPTSCYPSLFVLLWQLPSTSRQWALDDSMSEEPIPVKQAFWLLFL